MSKRKIPHEAFDFYFSLGPDWSYEKVAARYGVTKRAVTKLAARERWQERLEQVEAEARAKSDQKKVEALEVIRERHLRALRLIQAKALNALQQMSINSAMDAVRAFGLAVREERITLGESSERKDSNVEEIIKREYERWMTTATADDEKPAEAGE